MPVFRLADSFGYCSSLDKRFSIFLSVLDHTASRNSTEWTCPAAIRAQCTSGKLRNVDSENCFVKFPHMVLTGDILEEWRHNCVLTKNQK